MKEFLGCCLIGASVACISIGNNWGVIGGAMLLVLGITFFVDAKIKDHNKENH